MGSDHRPRRSADNRTTISPTHSEYSLPEPVGFFAWGVLEILVWPATGSGYTAVTVGMSSAGYPTAKGVR
jgi:hypothetical protein